jgi:hypothetical protein
MRYLQRAAGTVFLLTTAALILFWTVKDTKPTGDAVFPILYGALGVSAPTWLIAEGLKLREDRPLWRGRAARLHLDVTGCVFEQLPDGSTVLQLYVTVGNRGRPTTLTGWDLTVESGEGARRAVHLRSREPLPGRPVRPSLVRNYVNEAIADRGG